MPDAALEGFVAELARWEPAGAVYTPPGQRAEVSEADVMRLGGMKSRAPERSRRVLAARGRRFARLSALVLSMRTSPHLISGTKTIARKEDV